jgi:glycosyltransferase involved in cell wall biosynthesis
VGDHASAAAAIVELLEHPLRRRRLGTAARRRAARFTADRVVPRYVELYRTLVRAPAESDARRSPTVPLAR